MTMADTVAVMNKGKIEQMGPPEELYSRPHTAFVANFLGQSNLAPGQVVGREGDLLLVTVGGATVKVPVDRAVATTGSVLVGVRPEKIGLLIEGQEPSPNHNVVGPGIVTDVSFTGVSTQYQVEVEHLGTFGVFSQNLLGGATVTLGTKVRLAWSQEFTFGLDGDQDAAEGAADLDAEP